MTALYAVVLVLSLLALLAWIAQTAIAATVEGWGRIDPERRYGAVVRLALAGSLGFGLAGLSASYAGWPVVAALGAAAVGAGVMIAIARFLGPGEPE
jgi:hypothetical protein